MLSDHHGSVFARSLIFETSGMRTPSILEFPVAFPASTHSWWSVASVLNRLHVHV